MKFLTLEGFDKLREAMMEVYSNILNLIWSEEQIETLLGKFPERQVVTWGDNKFAGCALSIITDYSH